MVGKRVPDLTINEERLNLLAQVAHMYYEEEMTQQQISVQLGYSRSAISRLLTEARRAGVVEIRIYHPLARNAALEQELRERFSLREARVLTPGPLPYHKLLRRLGEVAARLLETVVKHNSVIGVSWGTSVYEVANALRPPHYPNVTVVQLIGALGTADPQIDGPELARWFARKYGGRYYTLPTPLVVENAAIRDALMNDRHVRDVLDKARQVDVAIVGIGSTDPSISSLVRAGYMDIEEVRSIANTGAVGDICSLHFDINGALMPGLPVSQRTVGVQEDVLHNIPIVLGVAGGEIKAPAMLGALRSGLLDILITDDLAARRVVELCNSR